MADAKEIATRPSRLWYSIWFKRAAWLIVIGLFLLLSINWVQTAIRYFLDKFAPGGRGPNVGGFEGGFGSGAAAAAIVDNEWVLVIQSCQLLIGSATVFAGTMTAFVTACAALVTQIKKLRKALRPTPVRASRNTKPSVSPGNIEE